MKKIKKVLFVVFIIWAICQIKSQVYGYTIDEVKEKIDFKIVEEEGEPDHYDVLIDARDMIDNEKLPCVESSIESVIYSEDDLLSIDFFGVNSSNKSKKWKTYISGPVKAIFKVLLYISLALMITFLIYMAILMVSSGISKKESMLPLSSVFGIGNGKASPKKHLTEKGFVEQWIITTVILVLLVYVINLIVSFSSILTKVSDKFKPEKEEENSIVVYVKNSKETVYLSGVIGTTTDDGRAILSNDISNYLNDNDSSTGKWAVYAKNLSTDTDAVTYNNTNQMPSASVIKLFIAAAAYEKAENDSSYKVDLGDMKKMITVSDNNAANKLIDAVGKDYINSYITDNGYTSTELNRKFGIKKFEKDNYTSASDVGKLLENIYSEKCQGASKILEYMKKQERRSKIPQGVQEDVTVANKTGELGSDYPNGPVENDAAIVYKEDANYLLVVLSSNLGDAAKAISNINEISSRIYNGIGSETNSGTSGSSSDTTTTKTFDYYFKTNLEGLLMFQSQYNWQDYIGRNVMNIVCGYIVTGFKIVYYVLFLLRVIVIAVLTAFAPLAVVINAFIRIRGGKGFLKNCLFIYLYGVFFRPVVAILYYLFVSSNVYTVSEYPFYVLFVIAGIVGLTIFSFNKLWKSLKMTKKQSKAKQKAK